MTKNTGKKMGAVLAASTCMALTHPAQAQPAGGDVVKQDFEDNVTSWVKFGDNTQLSLSRAEEDVHGGQGALQFNYRLAPRSLAALALADTTALAASNTISFWAKSRTASTMAFAIKELAGGTWIAIFQLPEDKWQRVELSISDFTTGFGPGDPGDADGKLALDKIEWAGIGDFAQFLLMDPNPELIKLFGIETGPRAFWLDDVAFDPTKTGPQAAGAPIVVDNFAAPQLSWIHLGGTDITREEKDVNGAKMPGLSLSYTQAPAKFGGVVRRVNSAGWAGATKIALRLASDAPATLGLQLEERGGGKYFVPILAPGDGEVKAHSFGVTQFQPSQESKDNNGKLNMEEVSQIILLDLAALNPQATQTQNTVWIGDISVAK